MYCKMESFLYFLSFFLLIFSIWTFVNVQKYQHAISRKNTFLEIEIEKERKNEVGLTSVSEKINDLEKNTQHQFLKIRVAIVNLDFTLQEIL
jgi:hypothetical protein